MKCLIAGFYLWPKVTISRILPTAWLHWDRISLYIFLISITSFHSEEKALSEKKLIRSGDRSCNQNPGSNSWWGIMIRDTDKNIFKNIFSGVKADPLLAFRFLRQSNLLLHEVPVLINHPKIPIRQIYVWYLVAQKRRYSFNLVVVFSSMHP